MSDGQGILHLNPYDPNVAAVTLRGPSWPDEHPLQLALAARYEEEMTAAAAESELVAAYAKHLGVGLEELHHAGVCEAARGWRGATLRVVRVPMHDSQGRLSGWLDCTRSSDRNKDRPPPKLWPSEMPSDMHYGVSVGLCSIGAEVLQAQDGAQLWPLVAVCEGHEHLLVLRAVLTGVGCAPGTEAGSGWQSRSGLGGVPAVAAVSQQDGALPALAAALTSEEHASSVVVLSGAQDSQTSAAAAAVDAWAESAGNSQGCAVLVLPDGCSAARLLRHHGAEVFGEALIEAHEEAVGSEDRRPVRVRLEVPANLASIH